MSDDHCKVGDRVSGAGTPTPGEPYVIPTVDENDWLCDMIIVDHIMEDETHWRGTIESITPVPKERMAWALRPSRERWWRR